MLLYGILMVLIGVDLILTRYRACICVNIFIFLLLYLLNPIQLIFNNFNDKQMKKKIYYAISLLLITATVVDQKVEFEEYNLSNGLHVILHQDNTAPVITTSVMYHVGAKDENPERTGFAHFFEHLLFEGTENIGKGEFFK